MNNSLAKVHPELVSEWSEKNLPLTPDDITFGSNKKVWKGAKMKNGIMKYHPAFIAQRKMQKELQNKGYNDIFIPNLMVLSPTYAEYKKALDNLNDRMCRELGLYYDSNYNLVIKKDNSK